MFQHHPASISDWLSPIASTTIDIVIDNSLAPASSSHLRSPLIPREIFSCCRDVLRRIRNQIDTTKLPGRPVVEVTVIDNNGIYCEHLHQHLIDRLKISLEFIQHSDRPLRSTMATGWSCRAFHAILCAVVIVGLSFAIDPVAAHGSARNGQLRVGFYQRSCPNVETIIYNSMVESYIRDKTIAPGVLRIAFHDCFVRGCDASVLLTGPNAERSAVFNTGLHGFDALDAAKKAAERACPGIVSAADVLQFAARDSVKLAGGYGWEVPAGRRDGRVSLKGEATEMNLPTPNMTAPALLELFTRKGLNAAQLVALSGAHTIGKAPCRTFDNRVHASPVDPTLPASFAASLTRQCPAPGSASQVDMDSTSNRFDSQYFKDIIRGRGLLTSDQALLQDARTKGEVYANSGAAFFRNFGTAMVTMSRMDVLTGSAGEIRQQIDQVNSS